MLELKTEVIVALIVSLVVAIFLALIQMRKNAVHKLKREHDLELMKREIAGKLHGNSNKPTQSVAEKFQSLSIKPGEPSEGKVTSWFALLFWLTVFFCFCWWAFSLMQAYTGWSLIAGTGALISAVMSFFICGEDNKRNQARHALLGGLAKYSRIPTQQRPQRKVKTKQPEIQTDDKISSKPISTGEGNEPDRYQAKLPGDSTLRRHYLTQLRSDIESGLPEKPTDFNLRRHYDTMVNAELDRQLEEL